MTQRKIIFNLSGDKKELYLTYINYEENSVSSVEKDYDLKKLDYMSLYNTILDDLNAEFDDMLAEMIDYTVSKVIKKGSE